MSREEEVVTPRWGGDAARSSPVRLCDEDEGDDDEVVSLFGLNRLPLG